MIIELWQTFFAAREPTFWEALITSYTGLWAFAGVVLTLGFNGYLQRRQFLRTIDHEARTTRRSIYAELNTVLKAVERRPRFFNDAPVNVGMLDAMRIETSIFDALAPRIGVFGLEEGEAVIWAYGPLKAMRITEGVLYKEWLSQSAEHRKAMVDNSYPELTKAYERISGRISAAIKSIEEGGV